MLVLNFSFAVQAPPHIPLILLLLAPREELGGSVIREQACRQQCDHRVALRLRVDAVDHVSISICAAPLPVEETVALNVKTSLAATDARFVAEGCEAGIACTGSETPRFAFTGQRVNDFSFYVDE